MTSPATLLSADDDKNLQILLSALPIQEEQISAPDCNTYKSYRSILVAALPFIGKLPIYGSKVSSAITLLMTIADGVCNVSSPPIPNASTQAGQITIQKSGDNEVRVIFPPGTTVGSNQISQADLYLALSRSLLKVPTNHMLGGCIIDW